MAVRSVTPSAANVESRSGNLLYDLMGIVNDLANGMNTLTAQLDADAGVTDTDYAANVGTIDTIKPDSFTTAPT